jgi:hypothetical protein
MRVQFKKDEIDYDDLDTLRCLLATTTGLLWLRVLSLLKSINSQLATFVLAIFQITRDIMWFLVILCVLVVSFAQVCRVGRIFRVATLVSAILTPHLAAKFLS